MAGHTPGPWGCLEDGSIFVNIGGWATILATVNQGPVFSDAATRNAALIAVAPDLLADLKLAAATLRRYEQAHRAKGTEDSTAKAEVNAHLAERFEATIAKAEGADHD